VLSDAPDHAFARHAMREWIFIDDDGTTGHLVIDSVFGYVDCCLITR